MAWIQQYRLFAVTLKFQLTILPQGSIVILIKADKLKTTPIIKIMIATFCKIPKTMHTAYSK